MENTDNRDEQLEFYRLRQTKARRAFIEVLSATHAPLSATQILEAIENKGVSVNKTTIYRELSRLEKIGMVHEVKMGDRKRYYELASRDHHHHLICVQCENVEDVDLSEKELSREEHKVSREKNFMIIRHSLEFFGLCQKCRI